MIGDLLDVIISFEYVLRKVMLRELVFNIGNNGLKFARLNTAKKR